MVFSSRSTIIRCHHGGSLLLSLLGSPTGVASSSTLVTVNSKYGSIYLCLQSASPIRIDCETDLRGAVFTPTIQWDSMNDESHLFIIGKLISSNPIDDNVVVRAFQGIWKHEKMVSITTVKSSYYHIKFLTEDIWNDILSRGPWTFKGDWLALATLNPSYSIDEYTFLSMNVWIRIYGIPSIFMDDDDIANHTGNSLGTMIGKVVKVNTHRINLNMVDYLRVGIVLDVTKPIRRCVAIGGSGPSPKLFPLQYERLPTLCHGCGVIGHALDACATFKPAPTSKLQYGDWLRYIPPKKQELNTRSKSSIRYLDGARISKPKATANGKFLSSPLSHEAVNLIKTSNYFADAESTNVPITPMATTVPMDAVMGTHNATDPIGTISAMEPKLAAATAHIEPNVPVANTTQVAGMIPIKVVASDLINAPTFPVDVNINVPVVAIFNSQSTEPFGSTMSIVSDRDSKFTVRFWESLHTTLGSRLNFSTSYHPQTDGQSERVIQVLEDMLSYQASIQMAPYEALYGRRCRTPVCWAEAGQRLVSIPDILKGTTEKVKLISERLKVASDRQKSYADLKRREVEYAVGDKVFLKISPWKKVMRFGRKGKLSPRCIGSYEIVGRVGAVAYRLLLPPELERIHDVFHVSMLRKTIELVKLKWRHRGVEEATWERKDDMRDEYPYLFPPVKWDAYALFLLSRNRGNRFGRSERGIGSSGKVKTDFRDYAWQYQGNHKFGISMLLRAPYLDLGDPE
ncbi:hypothetical protein GQ457_07G007970 [Hibiscus cannabinus]